MNRSEARDIWVVRMQALTGGSILGWEVVADRTRWWAVILGLTLMRGPVEALLKLFTDGRVTVKFGGDHNDDGDSGTQ